MLITRILSRGIKYLSQISLVQCNCVIGLIQTTPVLPRQRAQFAPLDTKIIFRQRPMFIFRFLKMYITHCPTKKGKTYLVWWCYSFAKQARRKQFRVGTAKIGSSAVGREYTREVRGHAPPEILKFSFSKMHIWRIL